MFGLLLSCLLESTCVPTNFLVVRTNCENHLLSSCIQVELMSSRRGYQDEIFVIKEKNDICYDIYSRTNVSFLRFLSLDLD
jgi:hypothetical protein